MTNITSKTHSSMLTKTTKMGKAKSRYDKRMYQLQLSKCTKRYNLYSHSSCVHVIRRKDKITVSVESYRFNGIKLPFLFHKITVFRRAKVTV